MSVIFTIPEHSPRYVTPYLPQEAQDAARAWSLQRRQPVFVLALDHSDRAACPNCGGAGYIYLRFGAGGPYPAPPHNGVITWYDGDVIYLRGWYKIAETKAFPCPHCKEAK